MPRTLILGIGNPMRCDDGVGNKVAEALMTLIKRADVTVQDLDTVGPELLDLLAGYDKLIIIDAVKSANGKAGEIRRLSPLDLAPDVSGSPHLTGIGTILELGKRLSLAMPGRITIYGIEVEDITTPREGLTAAVAQAVPEAVKMILSELETSG